MATPTGPSPQDAVATLALPPDVAAIVDGTGSASPITRHRRYHSAHLGGRSAAQSFGGRSSLPSTRRREGWSSGGGSHRRSRSSWNPSEEGRRLFFAENGGGRTFARSDGSFLIRAREPSQPQPTPQPGSPRREGVDESEETLIIPSDAAALFGRAKRPSFSAARLGDLTGVDSAAQRAWSLATERRSKLSSESDEATLSVRHPAAAAPATAPSLLHHRSAMVSFLESDFLDMARSAGDGVGALDLNLEGEEGSNAEGEGEGGGDGDVNAGGDAGHALYGNGSNAPDISFEVPEPCVVLSGLDGEALMASALNGMFHDLLFADTTSVEFRAVSRFTLNFRRHCETWINRWEAFRDATLTRTSTLRKTLDALSTRWVRRRQQWEQAELALRTSRWQARLAYGEQSLVRPVPHSFAAEAHKRRRRLSAMTKVPRAGDDGLLLVPLGAKAARAAAAQSARSLLQRGGKQQQQQQRRRTGAMDGLATRSRPQSWAPGRLSMSRKANSGSSPGSTAPLSRAKVLELADELALNVAAEEKRDISKARSIFKRERAAEKAEIEQLGVGPVRRAATFIHELATRVFSARFEEMAQELLEAAESVPLQIPSSMMDENGTSRSSGGQSFSFSGSPSSPALGSFIEKMQIAAGEDGLGADLTLADVGIEELRRSMECQWELCEQWCARKLEGRIWPHIERALLHIIETGSTVYSARIFLSDSPIACAKPHTPMGDYAGPEVGDEFEDSNAERRRKSSLSRALRAGSFFDPSFIDGVSSGSVSGASEDEEDGSDVGEEEDDDDGDEDEAVYSSKHERGGGAAAAASTLPFLAAMVPAITMIDRDRDDALTRDPIGQTLVAMAIASLIRRPQSFFGIDAENSSSTNWADSIIALSRLDSVRLPSAKIDILMSAFESIHDVHTTEHAPPSVDGGEGGGISSCSSPRGTLAADDLVPIFIYVLVHCKALESPLTSAQLMATFVSEHDAMGERGYYVTVFCSALSWIVQVCV